MSYYTAAGGVLGKFRKASTDNGWTWNGATYYGTTAALSDSEVAALIREGSLNAGDADPRSVAFTPDDFPNAAGPSGGMSVTRNATGIAYTVTRGYPTSGLTTWRVICYKTPPPDSATVNSTTGQRNDFRPPAATTS